MLAAAEVEWGVPQPPETAEAASQVEGLEATPAEQLAEELGRIKQVIAQLRDKVAVDLNYEPPPATGAVALSEYVPIIFSCLESCYLSSSYAC